MSKVTFSTTTSTLLIPVEALSTYQAREKAVTRMMELGGIYASPTEEVRKLMNRIANARRKIKRNGWYSQSVV